jgi:hypothetical protein
MNIFVPILYGERDFDAFDNVGEFVEISKLMQLQNLSSSWFESMPGSQIVSLLNPTICLLTPSPRRSIAEYPQ